jgi:hypothetical protein
MGDQLMRRVDRDLVRIEQHLMELLARTQTGIHDLHRSPRTSGDPGRDIGNAGRLPHVEDENLTRAADAAGG